jgi:hypothetical protein
MTGLSTSVFDAAASARSGHWHDESVHNPTPVLLIFSVTLPSVTATGRWRERGRMPLGRR